MYFFFLSIKRSVHPFCLLVELMMFSKKINIQSLKRIFYVCELGSTVSPELLKYSKQKNVFFLIPLQVQTKLCSTSHNIFWRCAMFES